MSGGSQKSKSTSSSNQTLDPWSKNQYEMQAGNIQSGIDAFKSGIGAYDGPLTAGLSESEGKAGGLINDYTGSWKGALSDLRGMMEPGQFATMAPETFADFNPDVYVNPYADEMIGSVTGDLNQAADRSRTQATADTLTNGAYGGSRHGVREGAIDESLLKAVGDASSGIRFNTWNAGADHFYKDVGNKMTATNYNNDVQFTRAQGLSGLLDAERGYQGEDISRLLDYGGLTRGVEDRGLAAKYADYIRQRQEEQSALGLDFGLLGSIPMLIDSTGENTTTETSNPGALGIASTLIGGASAAFGGGGMFGAGGFFAPKG